jgi:hypothetical protein
LKQSTKIIAAQADCLCGNDFCIFLKSKLYHAVFVQDTVKKSVV